MAAPLSLSLYINQKRTTVTVADSSEPLLYILRNQADTTSVKYGCGVNQCGACTVIVDGVTTRSCTTPLSAIADGAHITTLEGRSDRGADGLEAMKRAFVEHQAGQCAYCIPGIMMGSYNWLLARKKAGNYAVPTEQEVKDFLSGVGQTPPYVYLCRCGAHMRIVRAIRHASQEIR